MSGKGVWFRIIGWNIKSPTLSGPWPGWLIRRGRIARRIAKYKPDVFCGIEMGKISHVRWMLKALKANDHPMRSVTGGANWRYIFFNHRKFFEYRSGQFVLSGRHKGQDKELTWAVLEDLINGNRILVLCTHLEVLGPDSVRMAQAKSTMFFARKLRTKYDIPWSRVFLFLDCNDRGGVQDYLEGTELSNLIKGSKNNRAKYDTMNRWSRKRVKVKANRSLDWLGAGQQRDALVTFSPDCSDSSDHNLLGADVLTL